MRLPDEIISKIFSYNHPLPSINLSSFYKFKEYKQYEFNRYKKYNNSLLLNVLKNTNGSFFDAIKDCSASNVKELRTYINDYYGSYDEYYIDYLFNVFDDIKEITFYIFNNINRLEYNKYCDAKNKLKNKIKLFNKNYNTINAITIEDISYYSETYLTNRYFKENNLLNLDISNQLDNIAELTITCNCFKYIIKNGNVLQIKLNSFSR